MIKAMKKVCNVRLDSNRPYKAAALCPVTVAALMSTLSVTNAGDVNFAAVMALGLAFWMRPNEWFFSMWSAWHLWRCKASSCCTSCL